MKHIKLLRSCSTPSHRFGVLSLIASAIALSANVHAQLVISPGSASTPNAKAMLTLNDVTRGFLAPRFLSTARPTVGAPENSLLYYQTDSNAVTGQGRGYYYWDNTIPLWVRASMGPGWRVGGNAGTTPATDFIGTTNNVAMRIKTNGVDRINLNPSPGYQVQVGAILGATDQFEVNGAMRVYSTNPPLLPGAPGSSSDATPVEGAIRYNSTTGAHEGYVNNPLGGGQIQYVGWYQLENAFKTRVKQRHPSAPTTVCTYPPGAGGPWVVPSGGTAGTWPLIDVNGVTANPSTGATTETPYSTFWEDGRHQYLYLSSDLQGLNVCENTDIKGVAFQTTGAGAPIGIRNAHVKMKNESTGSLTNFINSGLVNCADIAVYPNPPMVVVAGWNAHQFGAGTPWQWLGPGNNMLVEFCFDNQDWTFNNAVYYEPTAYNAMYGLYCDACGSPTGGTFCYYPGPCPTPTPNTTPGTVWPAPNGPSSTTSGVLCIGWGWNGFGGGGCNWTSTTSLLTCDGTFQYQGTQSAAALRPLLKFDAQTTGTGVQYLNNNYMVTSGDGLMIGDYAAWANSALYSGCGTFGNSATGYQFKGPGTISARSSVWGGTVLLSDHVFDNYYDGKIKPEDAKQAKGYRHYPMKEMASYIEQERHLPTIAGREEWKKEGLFSVDQLTNQLWVTVETQSLYIKELNDRMNALQDYLVEKRLRELKR